MAKNHELKICLCQYTFKGKASGAGTYKGRVYCACPNEVKVPLDKVAKVVASRKPLLCGDCEKGKHVPSNADNHPRGKVFPYRG